MKASTKPLYQPWAEDAFRACSDVQIMSPIQRWMYRTLCQAAFIESTRPYLPNDDAQLWKLAGCENRKQWDKHKSEVRAAFTAVTIDGAELPGREPVFVAGQKYNLLSRNRIVQDWNRIEERRESLRERGKKGGQAKGKQEPSQSKQAPAEEESEGSQASEVKKEREVSNIAKPEPSNSQATAKQMAETHSLSLDSESDKAEFLRVVQDTAVEVWKTSTFWPNDLENLSALFDDFEPKPAPKKLKAVVKNICEGWNEFQSTHAGKLLLTALPSHFRVGRKQEEKQKREDEMLASMRIVVPEIARQEQPESCPHCITGCERCQGREAVAV